MQRPPYAPGADFPLGLTGVLERALSAHVDECVETFVLDCDARE
jgi:hypothetical protein